MKEFELVYYEKEKRILDLERSFKKLLDFEIKHSHEICIETVFYTDDYPTKDAVDALAAFVLPVEK